jgi:hypothetical protein
MRRSVAKARTVQAQVDQAATLMKMAEQLDRIEAKLDQALGMSKAAKPAKAGKAATPAE